MKVKIANKPILYSIFLAGFFLNSTPSLAYDKDDGANVIQPVQASQQLKNLDVDQIIKIETIRQSYQELIAAHKQKLGAEQQIFNKSLRVDTDEKSIRKAFGSVANAMEDVAVCQIKMMQEINLVLNAHATAYTEAKKETLSSGLGETNNPEPFSSQQ